VQDHFIGDAFCNLASDRAFFDKMDEFSQMQGGDAGREKGVTAVFKAAGELDCDPVAHGLWTRRDF
jgi:hypothetical protein